MLASPPRISWKWLTINFFLFVCLCLFVAFTLCHALKRSSHKVGAAETETVYICGNALSRFLCLEKPTHTFSCAVWTES